MSEKNESPFEMPEKFEEKLPELQKRHLEEVEAARQEKPISLNEAVDNAERELEEKRGPLEPTRESLLYIEEEGKFLTERQRELLKILAYFREKQAEAIFYILEKDPQESFFDQDKLKEVEDSIMALRLKYEDASIIKRKEEYPAARGMIEDIEKYIKGLENVPFSQAMALVWANIANRIESFQEIILLKDAKTTDQRMHLHQLSNHLKALIDYRIPAISLNMPKKDAPAANNQPDQEIIKAFNDVFKEEIRNISNKEFIISIPKDEGMELRAEFIELIQQKGVESIGLYSRGKKIILKGGEFQTYFGAQEVEIWYPGEEFPVHILALGQREMGKPGYVGIDENGQVRASVIIDKRDPESEKAAEEINKIEIFQWREMINFVLNSVRSLKIKRGEGS